MKTPCGVTILLATLAAFSVGCRQEKPRALEIGLTTMENESHRTARWQPLKAYLQKRLNRSVELRTATDYAGVVEALRSGHIDLAYLGAAAYAQAWITTGGKVRPIAGTLNEDGIPGYFSVIEVAAGSPFRSLGDLKGKTLAFADPNSTSGYVAPSFYLRQQGLQPESYFGKTIFAGSHEGAVLCVQQGRCDAAATWAYGSTRTNSARMASKGMIPPNSTRVIWKSPLIPTTAWTVRTDLPETTAAAFKKALVEFATVDKAGFAIVGAGRETGYVEVSASVYQPVIEMVKSNREFRKVAR